MNTLNAGECFLVSGGMVDPDAEQQQFGPDAAAAAAAWRNRVGFWDNAYYVAVWTGYTLVAMAAMTNQTVPALKKFARALYGGLQTGYSTFRCILEHDEEYCRG